MGKPKTLRKDSAALLARCPGLGLRLAARKASQFLDDALAPSGLSLAQAGLLATIAAAEDDRIGAIAVSLGLDPSTLSRNLRGLERDHLVEIVTAEGDLRRRAVWLTERGARQLETAIPLWRAAQKKLVAFLGAAAVPALVARAARLQPSPRKARAA